MASTVNGIIKSPKISGVTKRDVFHLYLWKNDQKAG